MENPASPEYQAIAESQRQRAEKVQAWETHSAMMDAQKKAFEKATGDYYQTLRDKHSEYSGLGWDFRDEDYLYKSR